MRDCTWVLVPAGKSWATARMPMLRITSAIINSAMVVPRSRPDGWGARVGMGA
ncbi:MAG: hypothetical protein QUV05_17755 [Phycisphaerae bacterium]|nr:hypothetical protein [Phycisphaerae bacterium]